MEVELDLSGFEKKINRVLADRNTKLEMHNTFARYMDPYVPMDSGVLASSGMTNITPEYVEYNTPYAHYQYEGVVYGPNIPIFQDGVIIGFFSIPNERKYPTGDSIQYSTEKHPLATHHWDQAMMANRGDSFTAELSRIISRRCNYGR